MGVNLIPTIEGFSITNLDANDASYKLGCIDRTKKRVLRFTLQLHNKGNQSLVIGNPADRPDLFVHDPTSIYPYHFKEKFYTFVLKDNTGNIKSQGYKVAFCLMDGLNFDCSYQGISKDNFDTYGAGLPCQFVAIDGLPDGEYILEATANAYSVEQVKQGKAPVVEEDNYDDNTVRKRLKISGNNVTELGNA